MHVIDVLKRIQGSLKVKVIPIGRSLYDYTDSWSTTAARVQVINLHFCVISPSMNHVLRGHLKVNMHQINIPTPIIRKVGMRWVWFRAFGEVNVGTRASLVLEAKLVGVDLLFYCSISHFEIAGLHDWKKLQEKENTEYF